MVSLVELDKVIEALDGDKEAIKALDGIEPVYEYQWNHPCFHCGSSNVDWDNDFSFDDYGLIGEGVVHALHCADCGARIEYYIGDEEGNEDEQD